MDHVHQTKQNTWSLLNRREGAFFESNLPAPLPSAAFCLCLFLLLLCSHLLFFLVPISLPGPTQEEYSPFVPTSTKCSGVGLAGIKAEQPRWHPEAAGSCNPVLQLDSAAAKQFKNQQC